MHKGERVEQNWINPTVLLFGQYCIETSTEICSLTFFLFLPMILKDNIVLEERTCEYARDGQAQ